MKKTKNFFFKNSKILPVDSFLKNVLYDKKFGYYNSKFPLGKKGDFITSPKISNLFSEIIAIWIISCWETFGKPNNFNIVEYFFLLLVEYLLSTSNIIFDFC